MNVVCVCVCCVCVCVRLFGYLCDGAPRAHRALCLVVCVCVCCVCVCACVFVCVCVLCVHARCARTHAHHAHCVSASLIARAGV